MISALAGDAAAGGVPFALAADHVLAREDVVLNPYYRHMGGLYGSEYWTYLLPRRVGAEMTAASPRRRSRPSARARAVEIGLLDDAFGDTADSFRARRAPHAEHLAQRPRHAAPARREAARAPRGTSASSRSAPTEPTSSPAPTTASSARTSATTRPDTGSFKSSAHRTRSHRCKQPRRRASALSRHRGPRGARHSGHKTVPAFITPPALATSDGP